MIFMLCTAKAHKILGPRQLGNIYQVTKLFSALKDLQFKIRDNSGHNQTGKAHKILVSLRLTKCHTPNEHHPAHLCFHLGECGIWRGKAGHGKQHMPSTLGKRREPSRKGHLRKMF